MIEFKEIDETFDEIFELLSECRFSINRTREKAEKAIELLEKYYKNGDNIGPYHTFPRGLIYYPDLLQRYINIVNIDDEDLKSMFSRCIETMEDYNESVDILLNYMVKQNIKQLDILLLPGKYPINVVTYNKCKHNNVRDIYYEWSLDKSNIMPEYNHNLNSNIDYYFGYRNVYHALIYAGNKCGHFINQWDMWPDCNTEAAFDFFQIPYDSNYQQTYLYGSSRTTLISKMKEHCNL